MLGSLRLYGRYISLSMQAQMQYKASFIMFSLANLLNAFLEFLATAALFARFGTLRGWMLTEVALFYGLVNLSFAIAEAAGRGFDVFHRRVRTGTFDRLLLRPRSTVLQVLGGDFQLLRVGRFTQGLLVLLWGGVASGVSWTPASVLLAVWATAGAVLVFCGLFVLQAVMSFWTVEPAELANTLTYGGVEATQFPLSIYRRWLRDLFVYVVPLGCANYFPVLSILGRDVGLGYPPWLAWMTPWAGVLFFALSLRVWELGVRHYNSTGS